SGNLIYNEEDAGIANIIGKQKLSCTTIPYRTHPYEIFHGTYNLLSHGNKVPLLVFGKHNMQNISGAKAVLETLGIGEDRFMEHIGSFPGADKRLEILAESGTLSIFRDFAHAPSKVKASVLAVKDREPGRKLAVFLELHTYSSLSIDFLSEYKGSLDAADIKYLYIDDHAIALKKLKPVGNDELHEKFNDPSIRIVRSPAQLIDNLKNLRMKNINLLFMSSGNFGGVNVIQILDINNKL
ncbi:MAG TPA: hypothetical protein VI583_17395, partial [Cyclobacteriaceae bacterium]|nr:hypothetical protein [Cyclobacteriaceae bacterium]